MSDVYVECLVKAKPQLAMKLLRILAVVLTVLFAVSILFVGFLGLILALVAGAGAYFAGLQADVEYEYLYLDKELSVDKVMAKTKRKKVATFSLSKIEIMAPYRSYRLDDYKNRKVTVRDFSIGEELKPDLRYVFYYEGSVKVVFSPSEELVKAMKNVAPRKVFTD